MESEIKEFIKLISKDDLKGALKLLIRFCESDEKYKKLEIEVHATLGRLNRVEGDRLNGVLAVNQFYIFINQIRESILEFVKKIETAAGSELKEANLVAPILEQGIQKSNQLLKQNRQLDLLYKGLLFTVLFAGFGILLFSIATDKELTEKIYLGSISMVGIFSSFYFYTRLRGIEILRYTTHS